MRWVVGCGVGALSALTAFSASAGTVGSIVLRGVVAAKALVHIAEPLADLKLGSASGATLHLSALANSPEGFTISLQSEDGLQRSRPLLRADDGSTVPYDIRIAGRAVDLSAGETQIVAVTPNFSPGEGDVQFVAARAHFKPDHCYLSHLLFIIRAR